MSAIDFGEFRKRIGDLRGREYWRSLEELSRGEDFEEFFAQEFPQQAIAMDKGVDRRDFVKLMGASVAFAGLTACNRPAEKIVPYVRQPENIIPGKPLFFASAMPLGGFGTGVLVESHMGRPTKIEGNPDHPASLGSTDAFMQASILGLYDPDRSQVVRNLGEISTWSAFIGALQPVLKNPQGLRLMTESITSPTLGAQIQQFVTQYPGVAWHQWEPVNRDNVREGLRLAFGGYVNAIYHFDKANVIVSLDSDFMDSGAGHLRYAREFASRRRVRQGATSGINRLYAIESSPSSSGSVADHRFPVRPSEVETLARAIFASLGGAPPPSAAIGAMAKDLQSNRGTSVVIAGEDQPPAVHAIAMAINQLLGNIGTTITVTDPVEVEPTNQLESLRKLVTDMNSGAVKALIILGGDPVFDAPADFDFASAFKKVPFRAHLSPYYNETSMLAHWHIPETHYLESWSDVRAYDGTVSIVQPLIAPLYNGRSPHEVLGALIGGLDVAPYDQVRGYWSLKIGAAFETSWRRWLNDGVIAGSALPQRAASASTTIPPPAARRPPPAGFEIQIKHDPTIYDGRFANNGWLQELPKPQTKITWENVLLVSPKTARDINYPDKEREALVNERQTILVDLSYRGRTLQVPLWVIPGHPDNCGTVYFGYGRETGGHIAAPSEGLVGVNVYPLRFSDAMGGGGGAQLARSGEAPYKIACTQEHQSINVRDIGSDRGIIRSATFEEYQKNPHFVNEHEGSAEEERQTMYPPVEYKGHAWAMVIDPSVCTGCNGCVTACQAENNIAVVGKDQVWREREMHWLRIDRYYRGSVENPEVFNQPVPCMQCENAPCEPVCPVEATSHSSEGLNDMTYNRCVGTRYCSNNCPYKVRRFNFLFYSDYDTPALKPMRNPDVTVRTRGVMEKCTYCVQRINEAKIEAEKQGRRVRDGEVVTACQQACPTQAIVFGDMNDPNSQVAKLKKEPANYPLLAELNTRPRTTYLGVVRNPNPEIKG
ncbi:MAG TPA: TAT-variant-translocated molybdopterin oxidoreductase [Thermoanaerobaculia bacterium]